MKAQHTPGPWTWNGATTITAADELHCIAGVLHEDWQQLFDVQTREANARLIAASPELLDACKALRAAAINTPALSDSKEWTALIEVADAAITKAQGRP